MAWHAPRARRRGKLSTRSSSLIAAQILSSQTGPALPKLYLRDTGLLRFLAGLRAPPELETWARRGASFEGLVVEELAVRSAERFTRPGLYFWRTHAGAEVDLLIVDGRRIHPVEIKLGAVVDSRSLAGLRQCMSDLGLKRGYVVTTGDRRQSIGKAIEVLPWHALASGEIEIG